MQYYSKHIFMPDRMTEGYLTVENGKITGISADPLSENFIDYSDFLILPGYIDIHLHGWGTGAFQQDGTADSLYEMKSHLPDVGVTSFLGTLGADPVPFLKQAISEANKVYSDQREGAQMLGLHLEGPFINKEYKGMQKEEDCILPDLEIMKSFYDLQEDKSMIRLMTIAPELDGAVDLLKFCKNHNIQCSAGHSAADFDCIKEMKAYGLGGVTHMFSAMKGFHHRELGVVGAALYFDDLYCEFAKQTGMTVKHEAFDLVYRIKGSKKIFLSTDCTGLARSKKEHYHYIRKETFIPENGKMKVVKDSGEVYWVDPNCYEETKKLELGYDQSVRNMAEHTAVTPFDIIKMTSENPARYIHAFDRKGSLEIGKDADFIVCDESCHVCHTYCQGRKEK